MTLPQMLLLDVLICGFELVWRAACLLLHPKSPRPPRVAGQNGGPWYRISSRSCCCGYNPAAILGAVLFSLGFVSFTS